MIEHMLELANLCDTRRSQALRREIREEINAFSYLTDKEFHATYHMCKPSARIFIEELTPLLPVTRDISTKISAETKVSRYLVTYLSILYLQKT